MYTLFTQGRSSSLLSFSLSPNDFVIQFFSYFTIHPINFVYIHAIECITSLSNIVLCNRCLKQGWQNVNILWVVYAQVIFGGLFCFNWICTHRRNGMGMLTFTFFESFWLRAALPMEPKENLNKWIDRFANKRFLFFYWLLFRYQPIKQNHRCVDV